MADDATLHTHRAQPIRSLLLRVHRHPWFCGRAATSFRNRDAVGEEEEDGEAVDGCEVVGGCAGDEGGDNQVQAVWTDAA